MIYLVNHLICNTRSQPQHTNHTITTFTIQHKTSILVIDNITFLYSPLTRFLYSPQTTQDSIRVTDNTKFLYSSHTTQDFYTRHGQHKISILITDNTRFLYSPQTTQDSILVTDNTKFLYSSHTTQDFYTRHGQHKISIPITDNTRFLYSPLNLPRRTQDSILVTDNTRFLYSPQTTQDFYTRHGQHKISILATKPATENTRFYTCHKQNNIFFHTSQTTQDFYITTCSTRFLYSPQTYTHTLIQVHSLRTC